MRKLLFVVLAMTSVAFAWGPLAHADNVYIGLQQTGVNSGNITTENGTAGFFGGTGSATYFTLGYGTFGVSIVTALAANGALALPDLLNTSTNVTTSSAGTLDVWITATDLTQPLNIAQLISGFTTNVLSQLGWTVTENVYADATDGIFSNSNLIASATFTGTGLQTSLSKSSVNLGSGPDYSLTQEYIITAGTSGGSANSTINTYVPEPGSLAMFGTGLFGLGMIGWMRRRQNGRRA